jgi:folate-binding protein YgfZ
MSEPGVDPPEAALVSEYEALRDRVGAYRLNRDVVVVRGRDAADYLQGQCSQDVGALGVGEHAESLLLAPEGKLVALLRVLRSADDEFVLDVAGGFGATVVDRLNRFKLRSKVQIEPRDWSCIALRGDQVPDALHLITEEPTSGERTWMLAVAVNGTLGADLLGVDPEAALPDHVEWCGSGAWEALRVEAGIPEMGAELDNKTIPAEAHLLERTVNFTKGCYTGQELVARLDARGNKVARRLCGIIIDPPVALDLAQLIGVPIFVPGGEKVLGSCTSAAWCPGVGGPAALGYLHRSVELPADLEVRLDRADASASVLGAHGRTVPLV